MNKVFGSDSNEGAEGMTAQEMFCYQCQEAAGGTGCTKLVCVVSQ